MYQNYSTDPRSCLPAADAELDSKEETAWSSSQTEAGSSTPGRLPSPAWREQRPGLNTSQAEIKSEPERTYYKLTCEGAAAETGPVRPSEPQGANRKRNVLDSEPHRPVPSAPVAGTPSSHDDDDDVMEKGLRLKSRAEGSTGGPEPDPAGLFCLWPRHMSILLHPRLLLQRAAALLSP